MDKSLRLIGNFLFMNDAFCIIIILDPLQGQGMKKFTEIPDSS